MKFLKEEVDAIMSAKCDLIIDCSHWNIRELKHFNELAKKYEIHLTLKNLYHRPKDAIAVASDSHGHLTIEL